MGLNLNLTQEQADLMIETVIPAHVAEPARDIATVHISTAGSAGGTLAVDFGSLSPEIARALRAFIASRPADRDRHAAEGVLSQLENRADVTS